MAAITTKSINKQDKKEKPKKDLEKARAKLEEIYGCVGPGSEVKKLLDEALELL